MTMGCSKIQKQFLLVIGMFLFLTMVLHLMPVYFEMQNNMFSVLNIPRLELGHNHYHDGQEGVHAHELALTRAVTKRKKTIIDIWNVIPDDDRIVAQVKFVPSVDPALPAKRILLANGVEGWGAQRGKQTFIKHECPIKNCDLIGQPIPGETVDARMFKEIDLNQYMLKTYHEITPRHSEQVWIMFALESPEASPSYENFNHVINWTATYRYDSTMITPYDKFFTYDNFTEISDYKSDRNYAEGKSKLAAVFVSNCYASNDRLGYIKELQQHMQVDFYGYCGSMQCEKGSQNACFDMLKKEYKFYLSFENANCRDYITEKLFLNALRHDVVPVVMGAHPDDYKRMAPIGSYIHVEEFPSAKQLAQYLIELSKNDEKYNNYFRWKQTGTFIDTKFWCRICSMLWDPQRPHISVPDLNQWWRGPNICIGKNRWDQVLNSTLK